MRAFGESGWILSKISCETNILEDQKLYVRIRGAPKVSSEEYFNKNS
jgi:hypothetical protein